MKVLRLSQLSQSPSFLNLLGGFIPNPLVKHEAIPRNINDVKAVTSVTAIERSFGGAVRPEPTIRGLRPPAVYFQYRSRLVVTVSQRLGIAMSLLCLCSFKEAEREHSFAAIFFVRAVVCRSTGRWSGKVIATSGRFGWEFSNRNAECETV